MRRLAIASASAALAALIGSGCGGTTASPTPAVTPVNVSVQEWAVLPAVATAPGGSIRFSVNNTGPNDIHEFVVIKTDLSVNQLPTDDRGAVDEAGGGMVVIGEIEDIPVGQTQQLTVDLEPGAYALICNIFDDLEGEAHYTMGMRTAFSVTE